MKTNIKYVVREKNQDGSLFVGKTIEQCIEFVKTEIRSRNKNDGFDEYWHTCKIVITEVRTEQEDLFEV